MFGIFTVAKKPLHKGKHGVSTSTVALRPTGEAMWHPEGKDGRRNTSGSKTTPSPRAGSDSKSPSCRGGEGQGQPIHCCHGWPWWLSNACDTSLITGRDSSRSWRTILSALQAVLGHTSLSLNSAQVQAAASQLKSMKLHPPTPDLNWLYE